jgi:hypothetical protein
LSKFFKSCYRAKSLSEVTGLVAGMGFFVASLPSLTNVLRYLVQQHLTAVETATAVAATETATVTTNSTTSGNQPTQGTTTLRPVTLATALDAATKARLAEAAAKASMEAFPLWQWPKAIQAVTSFFATQGMLARGYAMFVRLTGVPTRYSVLVVYNVPRSPLFFFFMPVCEKHCHFTASY